MKTLDVVNDFSCILVEPLILAISILFLFIYLFYFYYYIFFKLDPLTLYFISLKKKKKDFILWHF